MTSPNGGCADVASHRLTRCNTILITGLGRCVALSDDSNGWTVTWRKRLKGATSLEVATPLGRRIEIVATAEAAAWRASARAGTEA